jgi:hypothetical protein
LKKKEYDKIDEKAVCRIFKFYGLTKENGWKILDQEIDDGTGVDKCICTHAITQLCYLFFQPSQNIVV